MGENDQPSKILTSGLTYVIGVSKGKKKKQTGGERDI